MEHKIIACAIETVAKNNGISQEEVIAEIENAIREAFANAQQLKDEKMLKNWETYCPDGQLPSAISFIDMLAQSILQ